LNLRPSGYEPDEQLLKRPIRQFLQGIRSICDGVDRKFAGVATLTTGHKPTPSDPLAHALGRHLIDTNPAHRARPPRPNGRSTFPAIWTADQLRQFLHFAGHLLLCPAVHFVAHTSIRRGELAGLNWGDLDTAASSLSIVRTRQATMGRTVEG
jgi:integrase